MKNEDKYVHKTSYIFKMFIQGLDHIGIYD